MVSQLADSPTDNASTTTTPIVNGIASAIVDASPRSIVAFELTEYVAYPNPAASAAATPSRSTPVPPESTETISTARRRP